MMGWYIPIKVVALNEVQKGLQGDHVRSALHRGVLQAQLSEELQAPKQWRLSFDDVLAHWRDSKIPV